MCGERCRHGTMYDPALAEDIGDLRYDVLAKFLRELADKLKRDSVADGERKRPQLASALLEASYGVETAAGNIDEAWRISEPHMK